MAKANKSNSWVTIARMARHPRKALRRSMPWQIANNLIQRICKSLSAIQIRMIHMWLVPWKWLRNIPHERNESKARIKQPITTGLSIQASAIVMTPKCHKWSKGVSIHRTGRNSNFWLFWVIFGIFHFIRISSGKYCKLRWTNIDGAYCNFDQIIARIFKILIKPKAKCKYIYISIFFFILISEVKVNSSRNIW